MSRTKLRQTLGKRSGPSVLQLYSSLCRLIAHFFSLSMVSKLFSSGEQWSCLALMVLLFPLDSSQHHDWAVLHFWTKRTQQKIAYKVGWRGGLIGRASDSKSKDLRFEPHQEHKKNLWEYFQVKNVVLTHLCAQAPCIYTRIRMITCIYAC